MTGYILTDHPDGTVDVKVLTAASGDAVRAALLDAAPSPRLVRTTTHHARPGFRVPRALAEAAGLTAVDPAPEPEPVAPAPAKAPAKKTAPKKAAAKPAVVDEIPAPVDEVAPVVDAAASETTDAGDSNAE